jgi:DNA polymerase-3 subunit beta
MTQITVLRKELLRCLNIANQISPKKHEVDVLTFTKVTIADGVLKLESSNYTYESIVTLKIDYPHSKMEFMIKTHLLSECLSSFNTETLDIAINLYLHEITIKSGKSKAKLKVNTDFLNSWRSLTDPDPEEQDIVFGVLSKDFIQASKVSQISVGKPGFVSQPEFLNICFTIDAKSENLSITTSDRFRVSSNTIDLNFGKSKTEEDINYILPVAVVSLVTRSLEEGEVVTISLNADNAWFSFGSIDIHTKLIDGKYPDCKGIIPTSFSHTLDLEKEALLKAIKQVFFLSRNQYNKNVSFQVNPADKSIIISSNLNNIGDCEIQLSMIESRGSEEEWKQPFNATYLLDYLSVCDCEVITWEINPGKPSIFYPKGGKDKSIYLASGLKE